MCWKQIIKCWMSFHFRPSINGVVIQQHNRGRTAVSLPDQVAPGNVPVAQRADTLDRHILSFLEKWVGQTGDMTFRQTFAIHTTRFRVLGLSQRAKANVTIFGIEIRSHHGLVGAFVRAQSDVSMLDFHVLRWQFVRLQSNEIESEFVCIQLSCPAVWPSVPENHERIPRPTIERSMASDSTVPSEASRSKYENCNRRNFHGFSGVSIRQCASSVGTLSAAARPIRTATEINAKKQMWIW